MNCAAIPDTLFEPELFGHERGAFTGVVEARAGWFEQASGGTTFFDEIGEMPPSQQTKLLRTLQERTMVRLGGKRDIRLKAWMGATHILTPTLAKVGTETSRQLLACNMKRMIQIFGVGPLLVAIPT